MSVSPAARADAAFQEQIHAQWRDWRTYLQAHLTLLDAQSAERQNAFERADALEDQIAQAQRSLAVLPAGQRALFDSLREARRQQLQAVADASGQGRVGQADPDAIERQALLELLAEAEGSASGADRVVGWGDVPLLVDGAVQWYRVNVQALLDVSNAATYAAGRFEADDIRKRVMLAAMLVAGMLVFLAAWFLWPRGATRPAISQALLPTGNGVAATIWPIQTIQLTTADGAAISVPISATQALRWPAPASEARAAMIGYWRQTSFAPLQVCVPAAALSDRAITRLIGGGDVPDRTYLLATAPGPAIDLVVEPCRAGGDVPPRYGTLQSTAPLPAHQVGETVALTQAVLITVQSIQLVGPGQDPTLPADSARVLVLLQAPALDWPAYAPTLLLASGAAVQAPEQQPTARGVELRYLVPLPTSDLDVAWSVTAPETSATVRWRTTLAPPPDRPTILRNVLALQQIAARRSGEATLLQLTLLNRGEAPLQLTRDDLQFV